MDKNIFVCFLNENESIKIIGLRDFQRIPDSSNNNNKRLEEVYFPRYITSDDVFHINVCRKKKPQISKNVLKKGKKYIVDEVVFSSTPSYRALKKISFAPGIKVTGFSSENKFSFYPLLEEMNLPTDIKKIPTNMFAGCSQLSKINFDELTSLKYIGKSAFKDCTSLASVTIGHSVESIGSHAFENTGIISIVIPKNVYEVSSWSFSNCKKLTSIEIYSNRISSYAFYRSKNLARFIFDNSWLSHIGKGAFVHTKVDNVNLTSSAVMTPCKEDILSAFNENATINLPYFID